MSSSVTSAVSDLATRFSGQLLQPTDSGYEDARRVHNGLVDKRPALILRCRGVADVVEAVNFARSLSLDVAVRSGGHNVAGRATVDGGVMIDLSLMKGIYVDPKARTARAMGGATWGEYNRETQMHGLASTGGVISTTGVGGLTLGGGWAICTVSTALRSITCDQSNLFSPMAGSSPRVRMMMPTCSGAFAAAAETSESRRRSSTTSIRSPL